MTLARPPQIPFPMHHRLVPLGLVLAAYTVNAQPVPVGAVTLNFTAGILRDASGSVLADGALLQVIASWSANPSAPTAESFTGGSTDQAILWQGGFDSSTTGVPGATTFGLAGLDLYASTAGPGYLSEGVGLTLRWYPTLTVTTTVPGYVNFGQYGYATGDGWRVEGGGSLTDYIVLTTDAGGSLPELAGRASLATINASASPIPEPGEIGLLGGIAAVVLAGWLRRRTQAA